MTRAVCEGCQAVQPPDWQSGDLCVACGLTVRREKRCHWCTRLTPDGQFCRHCGSGLLDDADYGAARMLKAAGVDQFALPERLRSMDPAQRQHFARLYAPQSQMAERHVGDRGFAQSFLKGKGWTAALEDELLPLLPLPEVQLRAMTLPPARQLDDLERLAEIRDAAPFPLSAQLAALARVRLGARRSEQDAPHVAAALRSPDAALSDEAALTLADWRFTAQPPFAVQPGELRDALHGLYRRTAAPNPGQPDPVHAEAGLGLALLAGQYANVQSEPIPSGLLTPLLASGRPDLAFGAALALGESESLLAALRVPERRFVAAKALARLGQGAALGGVLPLLTPHEQSDVLRQMVYGQGATPELHAVLVGLLAVPEVRGMAAELLLREGRPEDALRLVDTDPSLAGKVLANPALSENEVQQVCARLLEHGQLRPSRLSILGELATSGRIPDSFVPDHFGAASADDQQELCALARLQLAARADPALHRFFWTLLGGDLPDRAREQAWHVLAGWYGQYGAELRFSLAGARHFFGSVATFAERLCLVIERPGLLSGFFTSYSFLGVLETVDDDVLAPLREAGEVGARLDRALLKLATDDDAYAPHRAGAVRLLGKLARPEAESNTLRGDLSRFLAPDTPWQVQRAALVALYPGAQAQAAQLAEWRVQRSGAGSYEQRAPLDDLIYQLGCVMSGQET